MRCIFSCSSHADEISDLWVGVISLVERPLSWSAVVAFDCFAAKASLLPVQKPGQQDREGNPRAEGDGAVPWGRRKPSRAEREEQSGQ